MALVLLPGLSNLIEDISEEKKLKQMAPLLKAKKFYPLLVASSMFAAITSINRPKITATKLFVWQKTKTAIRT